VNKSSIGEVVACIEDVSQADHKILLGHITGVHGLKGWVKVHSDTNPRLNIVQYSRWWLRKTNSASPLSKWVDVLEGRAQGKTIIARLDGVETPEQARLYTGATVAVPRDAMPALKQGEYYWTDLVGMQVQLLDGTQIGPVSRLFETGANDVMVVDDCRQVHEEIIEYKNSVRKNKSGSQHASRSREVLVPWSVPEVITEVDMHNKIITIDWDPDF